MVEDASIFVVQGGDVETVDIAAVEQLIEMGVLARDSDTNTMEMINIHEVIVKDITILDIIAFQLLVASVLVFSFLYVRMINRQEGRKPNFLHKLCCPVLSVLRWEGFEGDKPIYAVILGCFYSVFLWKPSEGDNDDEDDDGEQVFICQRRKSEEVEAPEHHYQQLNSV
mmetsp:Transcript_10782/g.13485  ORF Transcript_10782/g.13485 Transcript_10782/m.13485 type:complete len:169 (+) Transcript_10782:373-879(+)|eukprot:CAMPEP_0204825554 /NCGR_PEP_ID=MMETSP1346-20131115/3422_1 /ASSEMBLY_ACC=CAM_ASM_000771 /TAXON_ID=215587 /ORGANISM="Aplanochytrium stocchinoi, Strain GSBS06" /LENGTH=168 /DNA_ID=CAMNT_0051953221 /DNA_START=297 /DNA_END=803 /DNA_ORIENTATION=-